MEGGMVSGMREKDRGGERGRGGEREGMGRGWEGKRRKGGRDGGMD